jgi:hypothetical protein
MFAPAYIGRIRRAARLFLELLSTECPFVSVHQLGVTLLPCGYVMGVHGALVSGIPGLKSETWGTLRVFSIIPAATEARIALDFFGRLRDGRSGGLEAYFGMGSVAEWLVD